MTFRLPPALRAAHARAQRRLDVAVAQAATLSDADLGLAVREARAACPDLCRWEPGAPVYDATFAHLHLPVLLERLGVAGPLIDPAGPAWMWEAYLEDRSALEALPTEVLVARTRDRLVHVALFQTAPALRVPDPGSLLLHVLVPELFGRLAPTR